MKIYADGDKVKELEIGELEIGYGSKLTLKNTLVLQLNIDELKFVIEYPETELDKINNEVTLSIKK